MQHSSLDDHGDTFVDRTEADLPKHPRILIIKAWAIGDVLMATPILNALRGHFEGCHITWLVDQRYAAAVEGNALIDDVVAIDMPRWQRLFRNGRLIAYLAMSTDIRRDLKSRKFDVVINMTGEKWWTAWFNVAPVSVGLFPSQNPGFMRHLYTKFIRRSQAPLLHNSEHYMLPAAALGIPGPYDFRMSVPNRPQDTEFVAAFLTEQPDFDKSRPTLVFHVGTSQAAKCWPTAHFAELADLVGSHYNVILTGSPSERSLAEDVVRSISRATPQPIVAAGELPDLRHLVALTRTAAGVVTGDTSMVHIASALDIPTVCIYGITRPSDTAPLWGRRRALLFDDTKTCAPACHAVCALTGDEHMRCMSAISAKRVYCSLMSLLGSSEEADVPNM